jgi:hypothetical protein
VNQTNRTVCRRVRRIRENLHPAFYIFGTASGFEDAPIYLRQIFKSFLNSHKIDFVFAEVEKMMNTSVFRTDYSPSMWYFPRALPECEGQLYVIGDIRLPNTKVRKSCPAQT